MACDSTVDSVEALSKLCNTIKNTNDTTTNTTVGTNIITATPNSASFRNSLNVAPMPLPSSLSSLSSIDSLSLSNSTNATN